MLSSLCSRHSYTRAFTLIELLIVIAIIAILSIVIILVLNPSQLLQQARDSNRLSDLSITNTALGIYAAQGGSSLGSSALLYVSVPDPSATSSAGSNCAGLSLPSAPSGTSYFCGASSTFRNPDSTGWIPVNFSSLAGGSPLGQLPQDPINQTSSGLYYTYYTNGSQYILTAIPEAAKTKATYEASPQIKGYPGVMANGSNLTISPLYSTTGLVGYWPFEEGSGSSTADQSGNGNGGSWNGASLGNNNTHYVGGKVGSYAGNFDGSTDYVSVPYSASIAITGPISISAWFKVSSVSATQQALLSRWGTSNSYALIWNSSGVSQNLRFWTTIGNVATATTAGDGNWHQTVATYNGSVLNLYLDGSIIASQADSGSINDNGYNLRIGYDGTGFGSAYFPGLMDDVRIYNRALSASEIAALYNAQK
jgi:prepilin-type N-terminal cleavage/methylation domain-containing protein